MFVRPSHRLLVRTITAGVLALTATQAFATNLYWDNNPAGNWTNATSWTTDPNNADVNTSSLVPGTGDNVTFNVSTLTTAQSVLLGNANQSVLGLNFNSGNDAISMGGGNTVAGATTPTLTVGAGGITSAGTTGSMFIGNPSSSSSSSQVKFLLRVGLDGSQTWTNNGTSGIAIFNNVSPVNAGVTTLTLDGTNANTVLTGFAANVANMIGNGLDNAPASMYSGAITDGAGQLKIVKNGTGTWVINGASALGTGGTFGNSFSGGVTINAGILVNGNAPGSANSAALGTGPITFNGGELRGAGSATYSNAIVVNGNATISGRHINGVNNSNMTLTGAITSPPGAPGTGPTLSLGVLSATTGVYGVTTKTGSIAGFNGTFVIPQNSTASPSIFSWAGQDANSVNGSNAKWNISTVSGTSAGVKDNFRFGVPGVAGQVNGLVYQMGELSGSGQAAVYGSSNNTQNLEVGSLNTNSTFSGYIYGYDQQSGGSDLLNFKKVGTGSLTLSGENAFAGTTSVSNGTLVAGIDSKNITLTVAQRNAIGAFATSAINATTDTLTTSIAHGLVAGQRMVINGAFTSLTGTDLTNFVGVPLYVVNPGTTTYQLSLTPGISGAPVDFTANSAGEGVLSSGAFGGYNTTINVGDGGASTNSVKLLAGTASNPSVEIGRAINVANNAGGNSTIGSEVDGNSIFSGAITLNKSVNLTSASATVGNSVNISGAISGSGFGVTKVGLGKLTLSADNAYTGNTAVQQGTLSITNIASSGLDDAANVLLTTGAKLALDFSGTDIIHSLLFDNIAQTAGTWGSTASTATNKNDTWFSGTGVLSVSVGGGVPGDYNGNGVVDAADYVIWRKGGSPNPNSPGDYDTWRSHFGNTSGSGSGLSGDSPAVPEPATLVLLFSTIACVTGSRRFVRRRTAA